MPSGKPPGPPPAGPPGSSNDPGLAAGRDPREGWITLTVTVAGPSRKTEAQAAVAKTPGLLGLINLIEVV